MAPGKGLHLGSDFFNFYYGIIYYTYSIYDQVYINWIAYLTTYLGLVRCQLFCDVDYM